MPTYERPVALVLYREDHRFLLDQIIPRAGRSEANFDLIIASQPYRAKSSVNFRAKRIIAPLARALRAGGRLIGIHSHGQDPGLEIIQAVWPGENPFSVSRHELLRAVKYELGPAGRDLNFNAYADNRSIFRYDMEALPNEVTGSIGSSTAFGARNACLCARRPDRGRPVGGNRQKSGRTLDATREVLRKHNGLWLTTNLVMSSRAVATDISGHITKKNRRGLAETRGWLMRASYLFTSRVGFRRRSGQGLRPDFGRDRRSVLP